MTTWQNIRALPIQFWLALTVTLCSGTAGSAIIAQVTQLAGGDVAGTVAAVFGIVATLCGVILTGLNTQGALAQTVSNMPGINPVQLNKNASPALINLGADQSEGTAKILPPKS